MKPGDLVAHLNGYDLFLYSNVYMSENNACNVSGIVNEGSIGLVICTQDIRRDDGFVATDVLVLFPGPALGWVLIGNITKLGDHV